MHILGVAIVTHDNFSPTALDIKKFVRQNATLFKVPKKVGTTMAQI